MGNFELCTAECKDFLFNFVVWALIFWCFVVVFNAAVVQHFMFISSLTYCAHLSNYLGSLNTKSFVLPRDLTGQSLIDFQGLALSKNAISLWFFMFHLFCV
jgi:hypothetical protein